MKRFKKTAKKVLGATRSGILIIFCTSLPAHGGDILRTGFEAPAYVVGAFGNGNGLQTQTPDWSLFANGGGVNLPQLVRVQSGTVKSGSQALSVHASAANSIQSGFSTTKENSGKIITIEADIRLGSSTSQTLWQLLAGDGGSIVGGINIAPYDGRFELITAGFPIINTPLVRNTWYRLRFVFNINSQTYSVSLDNTMIATSLAFLNTVPKVRIFQFATWAGGNDIGYFDNFSFVRDSGVPDVDADLETIRGKWRMPGMSAIVVKSGRIMALGAAGIRRQGSVSRLLASDPVNIASCTKWMTATIAGRLVDRGVIGWSTRVRDLFSNYQTFDPSFHNATLDQFLAHRTGVQQSVTFENNHAAQLEAQSGSASQIRQWVSEIVMKDPPEVSPGTFLYANQGYAVAARMMEIASGKDWETLMREEVFNPIRMKSASIGEVFDNILPPKAPVGHKLPSGAVLSIPYSALSEDEHRFLQPAYGPGGYVACSLQDWAKFLHIHMTSDISDYLSPATALRLQQPFINSSMESESYGRGIYVLDRSWATPGKALTHSGDIFGQDTVVWMAPARDLIVAVFTNCRSDDNSTALALDEAAGLLVGRYAAAAADGPWLESPSSATLRKDGGGYRFEYATLPGIPYVVETSVDLRNWTPVNGAAGQIATGLMSSYSELGVAGQKFFRAGN